MAGGPSTKYVLTPQQADPLPISSTHAPHGATEESAMLDNMAGSSLLDSSAAPQNGTIVGSAMADRASSRFSATPSCDYMEVECSPPLAVALPARKSACILYVNFSVGLDTVCTVLLRLRRPAPDGRRLWVTPGGLLHDGESPALGALRELCEELLSMSDADAATHSRHLLTECDGILTGPYGSTQRHHAFMLIRLLGDIDALVEGFTPNAEVDAARLIPIDSIDGSAHIITIGDEEVHLRDKIGFLRTQAAKTTGMQSPAAIDADAFLDQMLASRSIELAHAEDKFQAAMVDVEQRYLTDNSADGPSHSQCQPCSTSIAQASMPLDTTADERRPAPLDPPSLAQSVPLFCEDSGQDMPLDVDKHLSTPAPPVPSPAATTVSDYTSSPSSPPPFNSDATTTLSSKVARYSLERIAAALASQRSETLRRTDIVPEWRRHDDAWLRDEATAEERQEKMARLHETELPSQTPSTLAQRMLVQRMPLWATLGGPLLELLVAHGLIERSDEPSTVFTELSMENISNLITLSEDDKARLILLGCKSDDQLAMPPPPPRKGVKSVLNAPSAQPGCVGGGTHRWQRCTICHGLVGGTDGSAICSVPGCGIMKPLSGRFCDCLEIEAHPATTHGNALPPTSARTGSAETVSTKQSAHVPYESHSPTATTPPPHVWHPLATSDANRAASHSKTLATSTTAASPPSRYSNSSSLAISAGHLLTAEAAGKPGGSAPWALLPPPPPRVQFTRTIEQIESSSASSLELFPREHRLPLDKDFVMADITHFAFYEHSGELREAWRRRGYVSASVADRPSLKPPSEGCFHFIGQVYDFVQVIAARGLVIYAQTSHVECGPSAWASWKVWPEKIKDGRMLQSGEELLWITCIGQRAWSEQPHTAHEHTIGPPTQVTNANKHGGFDKTWCIWSRMAGVLKPTNEVPPDARSSILSSVKGNRDAKMLRRSGTETEMADAIVASIDQHHEPDTEPRPANQPCSIYYPCRRALHHNFGILSASYAPSLSAATLNDTSRRQPAACLVPIAPSADGPKVMVPLRGAEAFGILLDITASFKAQAESASEFISLGIDTHHMHSMANAANDIVVAVPWDVSPVTFVSTPAELADAAASNAPAVWAAPHALAGTFTFEAVMFAVQRLLAMGGPVMCDTLNVGVWDKAKPVVLRQRARRYGTLPDNPDAEHEWKTFLEHERKRGEQMQADLLAADNGTGLTAGLAVDVRTAADYAAELPIPPQGLPSFTDPSLLFLEAPQRPPPLHTSWLARLPPQQVPPGFTSVSYTDALRLWARRMIADNKNRNMRYDGHCLVHGCAPDDMTRAADTVLGRGAGKLIPFQDGIGSFNVLDLLLETGDDGRFYPLDFEKPDRRVWVFDIIKKYIGATTDQEIMSFIFHGVRWKLRAPTQIRLLHNLKRLDTRMAKVNNKLAELVQKHYITAHPICKVADGITEDGPNPFLYLFEWDCPIGGADKPGKPHLARVVGDMSSPRNVYERNTPDGEPDGPLVVSFNDLSGPKGGVKEGFTGYAPFPHPEVKPRPRHKYTAAAYLSYYAHLNGTFLVQLDDDQIDCFFQWNVAEQELRLCRWNTVDMIDGDLWYVAYKVFTMNQGGRNSSKIACNGNEEWLDAWRRQMDDIVRDWMPKQKPAFQQGYKQRLDKLGFQQARPFWAAFYTDNFNITFCASDLAASGTYVWRLMNGEAKIQLQPHVAYGTCNDWIGGRYVLNGGFGCLTPTKRERAIVNIERSLAGTLSRELFEKNNSFLVHVADICDWTPDTLKGIWGPLKRPGFDEDNIVMTPLAAAKLEGILKLMRTRPLASFWSGVNDAHTSWAGAGKALRPIRVHAFDTCTDPTPTALNPSPQPHVAGMVDGLWWRFKLTGEWLHRHITLTESIGPGIGALSTVPLFPHDINVLASDATAAAAAGIDHTASPDLQLMRMALKEEPTFQAHASSMWHDHWKGWGNGIVDCFSRDDLEMAFRLAHAFGIKLCEIDIEQNTAVQRFLRRTLILTRPPPADAYQIFVKNVATTVTMDVGAITTAGDVLEMYKALSLVHDVDCYLVFQGKQLDELSTMVALGIHKHDTLQVIPRIRAGMKDVSDPPSPIATSTHAEGDFTVHSPSGSGTLRAATDDPASASLLHVHSSAEAYSPLKVVPASPPRSDPISAASPHVDSPASHILREAPDTSITAATRSGSPQPLTASAARNAHACLTADALADDPSEYAICRDNPQLLRSLLTQITAAKMAGIPKGTAASDEWGWKWAVAFGSDTDTRWVTPRVGSSSINVVTERWRSAICLFWIAQHMPPSARRRREGFESAKPTSPLLAVYAWHRVLRDCDRYVSDMVHVKPVLKGLCALVKRQYGLAAFTVHQAKILSADMLHAIADALRNNIVANWHDALTASWRALHPYLASIGERKEGFTASFEGDDNIMRDNFVWIDDDGSELSMTLAVIRSRRNGHLLRGTPGASKCDRLGITWSKQKQFFRYDDSDPLNFAAAFQQWELAYPCPPEWRYLWPAFSPYGDFTPFSPHLAAATHKQLTVAAVGAERAANVTIHSYRATLVSAMYVAKHDGHHQFTEGIMQAHVRHKTLEAMYGYGKLMPGDFADNVAIITRTDASRAKHGNQIEYEPTGAVQAVEAAIEEIEAKEVTPRSTSQTAAASSELAKPTKPATATTKPKQSAAPTPPTATTITIVGCDSPVNAHTHETWNVIGSKINLPNSIWGEDDGKSSQCTITHFLHKHRFPHGKIHFAYAVAIDNYDGLYAVRADIIARYAEASTKKRLSKQGMPRPC